MFFIAPVGFPAWELLGGSLLCEAAPMPGDPGASAVFLPAVTLTL